MLELWKNKGYFSVLNHGYGIHNKRCSKEIYYAENKYIIAMSSFFRKMSQRKKGHEIV